MMKRVVKLLLITLVLTGSGYLGCNIYNKSLIDNENVNDVEITINGIENEELIEVGARVELSLVIDGDFLSIQEIEWGTSNSEVLSISNNGNITALYPGRTSITLSLAIDGKLYSKVVDLMVVNSLDALTEITVNAEQPLEIELNTLSPDFTRYFLIKDDNLDVEVTESMLSWDILFDISKVGRYNLNIVYENRLGIEVTKSIAIDVVQSSIVEIFEHPSGMTNSNKVDVKVNNQDVFVFETLVNHDRSFSWDIVTTKNAVALFDFSKSSHVELTYPTQINSIIIRPQSLNVEPVIEGNKVSFTLTKQTDYVIEINGDTENVVHLFTNEIDQNKPDPNNIPENMLYYGPGVHNVDKVILTSNTDVYIAGGAVINGKFKAFQKENISIRGRGVIRGDNYVREDGTAYVPFEFIQSQNIHLEGITFLNPAGWTIHANFLSNLTIDRIKIISARQNGDGISLQSCNNAVVTNSFVRSWDDSLVVKNYARGTTNNILFENITIWTDLAQSMEVGFETNGDFITNVTFDEITVLHNFHKPVISIHNGDDADISNITFRNITVEDAQMVNANKDSNYDNYLIDFTITDNVHWSSTNERGTISNILIENLFVQDGIELTNRFNGFDSNHHIDGVTIKNLYMNGKEIRNIFDLDADLNSFVSDINVIYDQLSPKGATLSDK